MNASANNELTFIFGGARSGKSRFAESFALSQASEKNLEPIYVATGEIRDEEMRQRIEHHQKSRDPRWQTLEEPLRLSELILRESTTERVLLIDCLTLWLSNQQEQQANISTETLSLCQALQQAKGPIVLVSNEVGLGIVPANELARHFRDEAGRLNQAIAAVCQNVYLVAAGLTLPLKTNNVPLGPEIP
ncbi:MAG: bifunctional adenosylcobinamide kinase/adenosylcobinamide-phosphate guanylyltransferase [Alphaproteobacteria bacterium]|nr:bifunctional adenosylcobinamide kinase/adenosylcobinamide-phosphate guanylyltransferase [Alphaproteobacteria bacterium]MBT4082184.1 bifunctional adenosylcobinamide kinase/adenosylcobinamide-phosphate guanylyltransferase [Alphaproteobacteria bacterium]MBT4545025.1 bifunctional adenosylcobinamide kinase/adenosylcobinamide-phosphate guanylyltransferase [Alphaproteobacteria bacterium]MBT7745808.1 bifunctional adenosylcobinamide kinase/adenosylcobinamide-phosphate guanylyltransferase [Alphaproteob